MDGENLNIESPDFGSIKIDGVEYDHDVVVFPTRIEKRKKWITKNKHGTSHKFTREEMKEYLREIDTDRMKVVVVGTGHYGKLHLLKETEELLKEKDIKAIRARTPEAARIFIQRDEPLNQKFGIFHITC